MSTLSPINATYKRQIIATREVLSVHQIKRTSQSPRGSLSKRKVTSRITKKKIEALAFKGFCLVCYLSFLFMTALSASVLSGYLSYLVFWG